MKKILFVFSIMALVAAGCNSSKPITSQNISPIPTNQNTNAATVAQANKDCVLHPYSGTIPLNKLPNYTQGEEDLRGGMVCKFVINSKLPIFTFNFVGQTDNALGDIQVTEGSDNKIIQTITNTTDYNATLTKAEDVLKPVDVNFDGYNDLPILSECGATGNCSYNFYLYNTTTNKFVSNTFLSGLGTFQLDSIKKQITASYNSSYADWEADTYQYQNGQYILIQKIISTSHPSDNTIIKQTYQLQAGKMKLTNSTTTPE